MDKIGKHKQSQVDRQTLHFVRGMQVYAPVTRESIHGYLTGAARITLTETETRDRIAYLVKAGYLARITEWDGGEVVRYEITADGMDLLDGNIPPRNWKG